MTTENSENCAANCVACSNDMYALYAMYNTTRSSVVGIKVWIRFRISFNVSLVARYGLVLIILSVVIFTISLARQ